jgi:hypothetical protein
MGRTGDAWGGRGPLAALAAALLVAGLAACEGAPEKPDRGPAGPADTGLKDPGTDSAVSDTAREGVEIPAPDCDGDPGAPGCPCTSGTGCDSTWCNRRPGTCAATCRGAADCRAGETCARVTGLPDPVCADRFPTACAACESDEDCLEGFVPFGVACAATRDGLGRFCLPACGPSDLCPAGMACQAPREGGQKRCEPEGGPCPCTPEAAALGREDLSGCTSWFLDADGDGAGVAGDSKCRCGVFGDYGARAGDDCDDGNGDVHPGVPEACNLLDDDCNGQTDEGLDLADSPCSRLGVCAADGVTAACAGGKWVCDASAVSGYEALETTCDGKDNNCDGNTDEGLDDQAGHCLSSGVCAISGSVHVRCSASQWKCTYAPQLGYEADVEVHCDGKDNDCDGSTDEDFPWLDPSGGAPRGMGANCGAGACVGGRVVCAGDGLSATCSTAVLARTETCDTRGATAGKDENCDGAVDEDFAYGGLTVYRDPRNPPQGRNACQALGHCAPFTGVVECTSDGLSATCSTGPGGTDSQVRVEVCNDADDDCDGSTDEDLVDADASTCSRQGVCGLHPERIVATCNAGHWDCDCGAVPGWEAVETRCDGVDSNCDGVTDEGFGWTNPRTGTLVKTGQPCGLGACAGGTVQCTALQDAAWCTGEAAATPESCNTLDDNCDGRTDDGFTYLGAAVWVDPADVSKGHPACTGRGACGAAPGGFVECQGADAAGCSTNPGGSAHADVAETCNAGDDDCDGNTDEGLGLADSDCRVTGVCAPGLVKAACIGGHWACDYSAIAVYQADLEQSCDGLDNDCDGSTDEDFVLTDWNGSPRAKNGACGTGACASGIVRCRANTSGLECSTAGMATPESCNHLDDDCDGSTDELGAQLCDDGSNCTLDTCDAGFCNHAVADGWCFIDGACRAEGAFNPSASCQHCAPTASKTGWTPTTDGGACDADGNGCTVGDTCQGGACSPGAAPSCAHLDGICTVGRCRSTGALSYACDAAAANEGGACDDGNPCTKSDHCASANCAGTSFSCDDGLACTTDTCDGAGGCSHVLQQGFCVIDGKCWADNAINTANTCQVCQASSSPRAWVPKPNNDPCQDGNACTENDRCLAGACQPGTAKNCDDGNACTQDSCNTAAGDPSLACQHLALTGTPCDDGQACTWRDTCLSGTCFGEPYACNSPIFCVKSACDGLGGCLDVVNGGYCWIGGSCIATGVSKVGQPCLYCDPTKSTTTWSTYAGGTPCSDGDACTAGDRCVGTSCTPTGLTNCDDGNACTTDGCVNGTTGCTHTNNANTCSDNNACTVGDQCSGGACVSGPARTCSVLNPDCDTTLGTCACGTGGTAVTCGTTTADRCSGGSCRCGANPACDPYGLNPDCSKDATPKCACCAPGSSAGCAACPATRADTCVDGTCMCGFNNLCAAGSSCCDGTCYVGGCP